MIFRNLLTFAAAFAAISVLAPTVSANEYHPIIEEGKVWEYYGAYTKGAEAGMALHSYKFDGTVTVNGKEYHGFKMFKSEYYKRTPDAGQPVYEGPVERTGPTTFFREEEGKVYVLTKENCIYKSPVDAENTFDGPVTSDEYGEYLRYDFTLQDGQTLYMPYEDGLSGETNFVRVVIEEPVVIEGTQRIRMSFDGVPESELPVIYQMSEPFQGYVIEGIGSTEGGDLAVFSPSIPGIPNAIDGPTYESALACVYNAAGEVIYGTPFGYSYHPLFEEGKVWNVVDKYFDYTNDETTIYHKQISYSGEWNDGSHLLSQVNCFNQEEDTTTPYSLLEENRIIYIAADQTYLPSIDFNLRKGDAVPVRDGSEDPDGSVIEHAYIVNDEVIDIKGTPRRVLSIGLQEDGEPFTYWIEGIGSIDDWDMLEYPVPTCAPFLQSRRITSCYLNGECIFSYDDFKSYMTPNGIESVGMDDNQRGRLSYSDNSLHVSGCSGEVAVNVYSLDGTLCLSGSISGTEALSASCLPAGCYLARAIFKDGHPVSLKFIKK